MLLLPVVEEGELPLLEVKAVPDLGAAQAELVSEAAGDGDPDCTLSLDMLVDSNRTWAEAGLTTKLFVAVVATPFIGHDVPHASLDRRVD